MAKKVYLVKGALVDTDGKKEWIESIVHPNIHYKQNIKKYL